MFSPNIVVILRMLCYTNLPINKLARFNPIMKNPSLANLIDNSKTIVAICSLINIVNRTLFIALINIHIEINADVYWIGK